MAGAEVLVEPSLRNFVDWVREQRPLAAIIASEGPGARELAIDMRARCSSLVIPLISLVREATDLAYEEAFATGMDDVCQFDARRLAYRFRHLAEVGPVEATSCEKSVVIADDDRLMRLLIGRVFRDAGYSVQFASDPDDALARAIDPSVSVVVCSEAIDTDRHDEPLSLRAPRHGSQAAWIINTPPKKMASVRGRLGLSLATKIAVHDAFASPATLLFVANELMNRPAVDGRKSERLLYGAKVRFRNAGRDNSDVGYLYNISGGGVYVRTLAPPQRWAELWIELIPPRCDRMVHLEGTAVWCRRYGPGSHATVPCGFGMELTGGSAVDMDRYQLSYNTFLDERIALDRARQTERVPTSDRFAQMRMPIESSIAPPPA